MKTLWIGNFSFEDQLCRRGQPPAKILRLEAELAPCLAAAAKPTDLILCPQNVDTRFRESLSRIGIDPPQFISVDQLEAGDLQFDRVAPWGWSQKVLELLKGYEIGSYPALATVAAVNARKFSYHMATQLKCQFPGECELRDSDQIDTLLNGDCFKAGYVVKANYGQSGRQQLITRDQSISSQQRNWIVNRLREDGVVYIEPKVEPVAEFGVQWEISEQGDVSLFGIAQLKSSQRGQYYGSIVGFDRTKYPELDQMVDVQRSTVEEIREKGYFGPVGIDAMIYLEQDGNRMTRPLQDINARWTMGRLAMNWASRCFPNLSSVIWTHSSQRPCESAVLTSPKTVGSVPTRHLTWCHPYEVTDA